MAVSQAVNGHQLTRPVTVGASSGGQTQITGLADGDVVVVPARTTGGTGSGAGAPGLGGLGGGGRGTGGFGGGFGGGGRTGG